MNNSLKANAMLTRRELLGTVAAGAALHLLPGSATAQDASANTAAAAGDRQLHLKFAVKIGMVQAGETLAEKFALLKKIGYDGVELDSPGGPDALEVAAATEQTGLPVHGVVDSVHWRKTLTDPETAVREQGLTALQTALNDAKLYGATSVLLVPGRVDDNVSYADAYIRSQAEIRKAIPLAEELGIMILLENVWNNFLLSPLEAARYIDELDSDMVGAYFDIGNVGRYGWPEQWIAILGDRIKKLDVKGYSRKKGLDEGAGKGFGVQIDEGDINWAAVRQALIAIGYTDGWATAEVSGGDEARLTQILAQMRTVFDQKTT